MLPLDIRLLLEDELGEKVLDVFPVSGGCIGTAAKLQTGSGFYFAKWGDPEVARTFLAERLGLQSLASVAHVIRVPEVVTECYTDSGDGILVLEWIEQGRHTPESWSLFGRGLAEIHKTEEVRYGFSSDNFIGASAQSNERKSNWIVFFRDRRLLPQVEMARSGGMWRSAWDSDFSRLLDGLDTVLPQNPGASLVHGDLWRGNALADSDGTPVLIDPAVYYGHREVDIAMSLLFGEFGQSFYEAYAESWPLEVGFNQRRDVYNLYHLLNHLNLFGSSYASAVGRTLQSLRH
ncbi:MAG: fructosamine kinase family protein [Rhodothermia bacterium]|nr:MAG: fructosamine kinase family protein [Rhodothermia bacterium]